MRPTPQKSECCPWMIGKKLLHLWPYFVGCFCCCCCPCSLSHCWRRRSSMAWWSRRRGVTWGGSPVAVAPQWRRVIPWIIRVCWENLECGSASSAPDSVVVARSLRCRTVVLRNIIIKIVHSSRFDKTLVNIFQFVPLTRVLVPRGGVVPSLWVNVIGKFDGRRATCGRGHVDFGDFIQIGIRVARAKDDGGRGALRLWLD